MEYKTAGYSALTTAIYSAWCSVACSDQSWALPAAAAREAMKVNEMDYTRVSWKAARRAAGWDPATAGLSAAVKAPCWESEWAAWRAARWGNREVAAWAGSMEAAAAEWWAP